MSNTSKDFLDKAKGQLEELSNKVDKEKLREIDSKFSTKRLINIVKVLLVGAIISLSIYTYWNYDHNMGDPTKARITNKDLREIRSRSLDRWGY